MVAVGNIAHFSSATHVRKVMKGDATHPFGAAVGSCGIWSANQYVDESAIIAWVELILIYLAMTLEAIKGLECSIVRAARSSLDQLHS